MPVFSYLKLSFFDGTDFSKVEKDMDMLMNLSKSQKGFQWAELYQDPKDPKVYLIVSLWDAVEDVRAWEHHPDHEAVMNKYPYNIVHKRYSPL